MERRSFFKKAAMRALPHWLLRPTTLLAADDAAKAAVS